MIKSYGSKATKDVYDGVNSKKARKIPKELHETAQLKLTWLDAAASLKDLESPPGNRLEKLKGDLTKFHSIRINDQWRIKFIWTNDNNAEEVEIEDYH